ncbi:MAG: polysaccharide biosynthesis protein [Bacilli bacterium]|nr:polysaccharide biosynthesis protein [Bacilli bacterium]
MKKNGFIEGTIVATLGILIVKVIGVIYVIPFNNIIGERGGALYGYGYNVYQLFLGISSAGFPFAISKITSEYNALGYKKAIKDTYSIALKIISIISIIAFIVLFIFAPSIGKLIIGNSTGGNTYNDIAFVIRCVSFAILVIPFLSVTKGFLQGHKYITPYSISQVIEQVVRVIIILVGSYLCMRVWKLPMKYGVGVAVSAAFFGGLVAYIYLRIKISKAKLIPSDDIKDKKNITKKEIIKKIIMYSVPFILISLVNNLYITVDMILLSRTLSDILHTSAKVTESIVGVYTTWGLKLNNVILAVSTGLVTSLIPNIVTSFTKNDMDDVNDKFNKALQCVLLVIVPVTIFFSLLSKPLWTLFYGKSYYGPIVYRAFVYSALFGGMYTIIVNTLQGVNKYRLVIYTVMAGLIINGLLDIPLMIMADRLGFNPSYGAVMADMVGYSVSIFSSMYVLAKKYNFNYNETIKVLPKYFVSWIIFIFVIEIGKLIVPVNLGSRLIQIPILCLFGIISFGIYFVVNYNNGNLKRVFGKRIDNVLKKLMH